SKIVPCYQVSWGGYAHNGYLQIAAETGIIGLLAFLSILLMFFWTVFKNFTLKENSFVFFVIFGGSAGLLAFWFHSLVDTTFFSVQLGVLMWMMMGLVMTACRLNGANNPLTKQSSSI
ncbi:MAG: O-antigen ligase family protein, partial [Candidatus Omnitrophica bacterium]|nr:O-antigen ligase family protein [Candidatus Omnitrophota bacterium]